MLFIAFVGACVLQSVCALDFDASFLTFRREAASSRLSAEHAQICSRQRKLLRLAAAIWYIARNRAEEVLSKFSACVRYIFVVVCGARLVPGLAAREEKLLESKLCGRIAVASSKY